MHCRFRFLKALFNIWSKCRHSKKKKVSLFIEQKAEIAVTVPYTRQTGFDMFSRATLNFLCTNPVYFLNVFIIWKDKTPFKTQHIVAPLNAIC